LTGVELSRNLTDALGRSSDELVEARASPFASGAQICSVASVFEVYGLFGGIFG
jgi:hypothetical protein